MEEDIQRSGCAIYAGQDDHGLPRCRGESTRVFLGGTVPAQDSFLETRSGAIYFDPRPSTPTSTPSPKSTSTPTPMGKPTPTAHIAMPSEARFDRLLRRLSNAHGRTPTRSHTRAHAQADAVAHQYTDTQSGG